MTDRFIEWEGITLVSCMFWGMVLSVEYDCIRIFRRIVKHKKVFIMSLEDIIFWINAGVVIFAVIYQLNDGIIRSFSIAGFVLGAIIYHYSFGTFFVKYVSKFILFILKPLKKLCKFIKMIIVKLCHAVKRKGKQHEI